MRTRFLLISTCVPALAVAAWAQAETARSIASSGTARIERQAEVLRMQIEIIGKDKDVEQAVAKLKERKDAALKKLTDLGATPETIKFASMSIGSGGSNSQADMQRMVLMRMRGASQPDPSKLAALPKTASLTVTAEWPLKGEAPEDVVLYAHQLQEKIKEADVAGGKDAAPLTPEEQELQEELAEMSYGDGPAGQAGEPSFVFVARLGAHERLQAYKEAFTQAQTRAEQLAQAAGKKLGALRGLGGGMNPLQAGGDGPYAYYMQAMMMEQASMLNGARGDDEAVGPQPTKITTQVTVQATFDLES